MYSVYSCVYVYVNEESECVQGRKRESEEDGWLIKIEQKICQERKSKNLFKKSAAYRNLQDIYTYVV